MTLPARLWIRVLGSVALVGFTLSILIRGLRLDWRTGDTTALVAGLPGISQCLVDRVVIACASYADEIAPFSLIQTVPAYLLHVLGLGDEAITHALAILNAVVTVVFCVAFVCWCFQRFGLATAVVSAFLMIPGSMIAYTAQTFGEPLAIAAFGGLALASLRSDRVSWFLAPTALVAAVSKDTAPLFVVVFGLAGIALSRCDWRTARRSKVRNVAMTLSRVSPSGTEPGDAAHKASERK